MIAPSERIYVGGIYRDTTTSGPRAIGRVFGVSGHPTIADEVLVAIDHGKVHGKAIDGDTFRANYTRVR